MTFTNDPTSNKITEDSSRPTLFSAAAATAAKLLQSCLTLRDPTDSSPRNFLSLRKYKMQTVQGNQANNCLMNLQKTQDFIQSMRIIFKNSFNHSESFC